MATLWPRLVNRCWETRSSEEEVPGEVKPQNCPLKTSFGFSPESHQTRTTKRVFETLCEYEGGHEVCFPLMLA